MTFSNHTNSIISQAIKSAVDGVLEKSRHERQELLRDFIETAARVFILQRTTQDCEEGDEADVFKDNLFAETNQDQHQLLELEDPHDQVRDFVGAPIYDDYGDDFYREPCHISDVMTKEGDTSPQRKLLSPIDIHEINDNMTRETLFGRPIVTNDVKSYYVPVTNLTDEPIYDVSDDEVFIDSHYCLDPLFNDEDEVQGLNNGIDVHVVVDDGNICVRKEGIKYYLGEKDCHQQFHRNPPDRDKNHTYGAPFVTHNRRSIGSSNTRFMEETGSILKLDHDHQDCLSKLSFMEIHALENRISYLQEALALEKEKNMNLEQELTKMHKKIRMLNNGSASLDKILTMGRTEKSTMGLGYQGGSSNSQTVFVRGKSAEQNKTRVVLNDEFSGPLECIDAHRCLQTESEFSMEPAYGVCKEEVRIQDECNEFDVQQREFLQFPMSRCGIGVNKLDGETKFSHDIVKLESMDKKRGYMWLIENSTHESFSFSLTDAEEEARDYALASVIFRTLDFGANMRTAYHEQLLSFSHIKSDSFSLVLISCCSTFYSTGVVVLKMTAALVFIHASVPLHVSFSWIIHITGSLKRVAAFQSALQRRLLAILVTKYHCAVFQPSIIWEAWIWILPPALVDDASCRETKKTKSNDAQRKEMTALAVIECLTFRARHELVLPRLVVRIFLEVCGDVLCFLYGSHVPMSRYQVFVLFIHQRFSVDREKCNFDSILTFLLIKRCISFDDQHGCARLVWFFYSRLDSYQWCFAHVLHWSFSSRAENLHEGSNDKDSTIVCWSDVACISSESLFGSIFGAGRECLYFSVISSGFLLVDLFHLVNQRVQGFICIVAYCPSYVSPMGYCWILVIMDKVSCSYDLSVERLYHTFSIILDILVGGIIFFIEHSIKNVELQLAQVKKSICVAYHVRCFLFHRGHRMLFVILERKMFSFVRPSWSSLALGALYPTVHLLRFVSFFHALCRGVDMKEFDLVYLEFTAAGSAHMDVVESDVTRNSVHAKESEGSYGTLKTRKMGPLEILGKMGPHVHAADVFHVKRLFIVEPGDALLSGFVGESLKGGGT